MERINYFTGKFSGFEFEDYFHSLNEEKLNFELENFINQYLKLSEEEQLKYAGRVLYVCMSLIEKIGKTTAKYILVTLNKILLNNVQSFGWFQSSEFLTILYYYLRQTKEYEDYNILFENESYFFKILDLIYNYNMEYSEIIFLDILSVFVKLFEQNSLPEERRDYFKRELESFINFIFKDNNFKDIAYWYFELDELLSIDTLTNFLIKADWKNQNNSETQPPFLRLTNLKQLNDPMEGRAIHDYLGIDNTFFHNYQTSNVFISSLTVVSDSLPMWKEYADSCQGAFLEYDMSYLEHIVAHKSIEFVKIHYLDLNSGAKDESDVGKALDILKQIFEKMQEFEGETPLSDLAEKLKKISYLFKVKDYEYEMEYRILINLDDTSVKTLIENHNKSLDENKDFLNDKFLKDKFLKDKSLKKEDIGLEIFDKVNYNDFRKYIVLSPKGNGRYDLFVYINLLPLKYSKVILGPKVTDADYIAPYLKLANPDIEIESSKIPYR